MFFFLRKYYFSYLTKNNSPGTGWSKFHWNDPEMSLESTYRLDKRSLQDLKTL